MDGMRIVRYKPGGLRDATVLTPDFASACDPAVSFDGTQILFTGKKFPCDSWQIWRMNADGSDKVQITHRTGDCVSPLYIGTLFHLDDAAPTEQFVYVSSDAGWVNECGYGPSLAIYTARLDGSHSTQITYNLSSDFDPDVLPNGRLVFTSWRRSALRGEDRGVFGLMAINNDGTDMLPYYGNLDRPAFKGSVCVNEKAGRVYFIESERSNWLGGGDLSYVSMRRPLHSHGVLAKADGGCYANPCALPDGGLIASYASNGDAARYGLFRIDSQTGERLEAVYRSSEWHCIDAQALAPHDPVKGRSSVVNLEKDTGVFYCLSVYNSQIPGLKELAPGSVKQVRVVEGIPLLQTQPRAQVSSLAFSGVGSNQYTGVPTAAKRILGVAPVEEDGSFHVEVPAHTPVAFHLLDERNQAIYKQDSWTWVPPREWRGCVGCHEDREMAPPNQIVSAVVQKARKLTLPPRHRRTVDFVNQIKPILEANCSGMGCHSPGGTKPILDLNRLVEHPGEGAFFSAAYETLLSPIEENSNKRYVVPGSAKDSPLIWRIMGERTDGKPSVDPIMQMPPAEALSPVEKTLSIEWIDLGALYDVRPLAEAFDAKNEIQDK